MRYVTAFPPALPHSVIDSNSLRNAPLVRERLERYVGRGLLVVLPAEFILELTKSSRPESTARTTLRALSEYPRAVAVAWPSSFLRQREIEQGFPVGSILWEDMTNGLQAILTELPLGGGPPFAHFVKEAPAQRELFKPKLAQRKSILAARVDAWKKHLQPSDEARSVKTALMRGDREPLRQMHARLFRVSQMRKFFTDSSVQVADALALQPSASALYFMLMTLYTMEWALTGGFDGAKQERIANDLTDLEFVFCALYADEFVTKDLGARTRYEDAKAIASLIWPEHAELYRSPAAPQYLLL